MRHGALALLMTLSSFSFVAMVDATPAIAMKPVRSRAPIATMAAIPAGQYHPLYADGQPTLKVESFSIDRQPVTRAQFLAFARTNPTWLKDVDTRAIALDRPMTSVTWFAARAYCTAQGKRLPTTAEWEYVAAADERRRDATRDPAFAQRLVALYTTRPESRIRGAGERFRNVYGVSALHGVVWEWTSDFDGGRESRDGMKGMARMDHAQGGHEHMLFCASAAIGASNPRDYAAFMRYGFRAGLTRTSAHQLLGFRCAA